MRTEVLAGAATWLTMAYIALVNPHILSAAGIDPGAAFTATCVAAAIGSAAMALFADLPLAGDRRGGIWVIARASVLRLVV